MTILFFAYNICVISLFGGYLARYKPDEFNYAITTLMFNCVYIYSRVQLNAIKFQKKIDNSGVMLRIKNLCNGILSSANESAINKIEFVKNGEVVEKISGTSIFTLNEYLSEKSDYDFAIYDFVDGDDKHINKKIIQVGDVIQDIYEISNIRFFLFELTVGENKMIINLTDKHYNFYVVGNVFTKDFIKYYLKNIYNNAAACLENTENMECFCVSFLDHNISKQEINFNDNTKNIILNKEYYILNQ